MANKTVTELQNRMAALDARIAGRAPTNPNTPAASEVFGAPYARKGESSMGSRGFQFQRLFGMMAGVLDPEQCKVEVDVTSRMRKHFIQNDSYRPTGGDRYVAPNAPAFLCPLAADLLLGEKNPVSDDFKYEMKSLCLAGTEKLDQGEMEWLMKKHFVAGAGGYEAKTAQSWIDQTLGGSLVPPAAFGELIQLLRNKDALINAGARMEPLPANGRIKYPRQTTATTGYMIGEGLPITPSNFGTGFVELSAKKGAVLVTLNNELIRYASPASEAITRSDIAKTLALTADYQLLYGEGSDVVPLGLVNTPNIATVTPSDTNGTQLAPQDLFSFISAVEANNAEFEGFILRPELFYAFVQARAGVYNGSAVVAQGQFTFDQMRQLGQGYPKSLGGFPATTTAQVSITRGGGTGTTVFGGMWSDFLFCVFGGVEFALATQGDTAFANDQTVIRGILSFDGAPRHPGAFAVADGILQTVGV